MFRQELNDEEVRFFHENGYLHVRGVVSPEVIEHMREATAEFQERYRAYRDEPKVYYTSANVTTFDQMMSGSSVASDVDDRVLWRVDELEERMPEVAALKRLRFVHNAMRQLLGEDTVQYNESFVTKPPHIGMPVHWHQDPSFKIRKVSDPISTCDIYLDKADEDNGCIWVVPGSHKLGVISNEQIAAWTDTHGFRIPGAVPVQMEPGDVAFHNNGCLHGSQANCTDRQRRIVYLAFQTIAQAQAGGDLTDEMIEQKRATFETYRQQAFGETSNL